MKERILKRYVFNIFVMIWIFVLVGCGKRENNDEEINVLAEDVTYEGTDIVLQDAKGAVKQYSMNGEEIYVLTCQQTEFYLYKVQKDGSNLIELPMNLSEGEEVNGFLIREDDSIICLISDGEADSHSELVKLNADGTERNRKDITESLQMSEGQLFNRILTDKMGNIILADHQSIYFLNQELEPIGEVKVKNKYNLLDFAQTKTGLLICALGEETANGEVAGDFCILDPETKKWGKTIKTPDSFSPDENCLADGGGYDFYYKNGFGIYGYTIEEKTWTMVLDARYSFLTSEDVKGMVSAGEDKFLGVMSWNTDMESSPVMEMYVKLDKEELAGKQTITYAAYNVPNALRIAAREFNKENKDCRVEFKIYDDDEHVRLRMDIIAGNAPDIIDISALGLSSEECVAKNLLEDLTPFYEKDTEIRLEDVIPSVLEGMKTNGRLYCIAPYFSISSAVGKTSDVGKKTGWTFDEMKEVLAEKGADVIPFDSKEKGIMLSDFLSNGLGDFVNWETGECSFNSQEFKDILELCNGGEEDTEKNDDEAFYEELDDMERKLANGKVLLAASNGVTLEEIQLNRQRFGEDITYIGFPNKERKGSYFSYPQQYGIYSKSNVKEKAWEFIRLVMGKEYQTNINYLDYFMMPTRQDCFDWKVKAKMATQPYIDEFGQEIEPLETRTYNLGDTEIMAGPVSQEDVDIFVDLMNHTSKKVIFDEEMIDIVYEESQAYFNGDKSLDKTAEIIQQRITTYVSEKR